MRTGGNVGSNDHGLLTCAVIDAAVGCEVIQLRLLGPLELGTADGRALHSLLCQPKRLGLLAFLALSTRRGYCRRASLLALFWPELDSNHARRALNQAFYVLRQELGKEVLSLRGDDEVRANPEQLWCDAASFDALLESGQPAEALALYRGEFLSGFYVAGCPEFERWIEAERFRFSRRAVESATRLAQGEQHARNPVGAVHWLREASRLAPYEEPLQRQLLQALDDLGDRPGAIREFAAFKERLAKELELEPSEALTREAERLRKVSPGPVAVAAGPSTEAPSLQQAPGKRRRGYRWILATTAGALGLLGGVLYLGARTTRATPGNERERVLVLALENLTGDSAHGRLGRIAGEWIADGLARSGLVEVIPPSAVWRSGEQPLVGDAGRGLVVRGSIVREADGLVLRGEVARAETGRLLRAVSVRIQESETLAGVEELRRQITGALASAVDQRLASWMGTASQPPSLEAYQLFVDGLDLLVRSQWIPAAVALERGARSDSGFTAPLLWALYARHGAGDYARADSLVTILMPRRDRLPSWDRAMFDFLRGRLSGDQQAAYRAIRRVAELMPEAEWLYLRAAQALLVNRPGEAVEVLRRLETGENPLARRQAYRWLTDALHRLGDYDGELAAAARARRADVPRAPLRELRALAALGRDHEVVAILERELATRQRDWATGNLLWNVIAELRAHEAPVADSMTRVALDWYRRATARERTDPRYRERLGQLLLLAGRSEEARAVFEALRRESPVGRDLGHAVPARWLYLGPLGILAAQGGDSAEALRLSTLIESHRGRHDYGEGTVWRAAIAAQLGDLAGGTVLFWQAMEEGLYLMNDLFIRPDLARLRDYPPFQELLRPR